MLYILTEDVIFDMDGEETTPTVQLHELKCMLMELITKVDASNKMLRVLYQHQHHKNQTKNNRRKRATFRDYFPIKSIEMWDEVNERLETDEVFTSRLVCASLPIKAQRLYCLFPLLDLPNEDRLCYNAAGKTE